MHERARTPCSHRAPRSAVHVLGRDDRRRRRRRRQVLRHRRCPGPGPRRRHGGLREGQVHGHHGPVRIGQVDPAALPCRSRHADLGRHLHRRHVSRVAERQGTHRTAPHQGRLRLPGVQPDPHADGRREHQAADDARRRRGRPGVDRSGRHHRGPGQPAEAPAERTLRRPAATRGRRPGPRLEAGDHLRRRADGQPRLDDRRRDSHVHAQRRARLFARRS